MATRLREQDRARAALEAVRGFERDRKRKEIRQELQAMPSRLLVSGLGQTLAFFLAKEPMHRLIADNLARHLDGCDAMAFLERVMNGDAATYRRKTREALAYSEWLKRYAKALIPDEEGGE